MTTTDRETQFTGTTHIGVVLDKSGSMGGVRRETIDGFNVWLDAMKQSKGNVLVSITLFDTSHTTPVVEAPIDKVNPLDESRYLPGGSTALLDAVADTIAKMERADNTSEDRYLVCIVTDGQENASTHTTKEDLSELIRQKEATGRWTFTYLSAAPDAFADATSIGVRANNTQAYTADAVGTLDAFTSAALNTRSYVSSPQLKSDSFFGGSRHASTSGVKSPVPAVRTPKPRSSSRRTTWTSDGQESDSTSASGGWLTP